MTGRLIIASVALIAACVALLVCLEVVLSIMKNSGVMKETETGVVFRLGHARRKTIGPGPYFKWFGIDRIVRMPSPAQQITLPIESQEVMFKGGAPVRLRMTLTIRIRNAVLALTQAEDYEKTTIAFVREAAMAVFAGQELEILSTDMSGHFNDIQIRLQKLVESMGIEVASCKLGDIDIPEQLRASLTRPAAAEADAKADLIQYEHIGKALRTLSDAILANGYDGMTPQEAFNLAVHYTDNNAMEGAGGLFVRQSHMTASPEPQG